MEFIMLGMASCIEPLTRILDRLGVDDPEYASNILWTQTLGTMHLARIGLGVREAAPGEPGAFPLDAERVREACVRDALSVARAGR